jgi:hypothetical protein
VRPDQAGRFIVEGLPPGRYVVAAVDGVDAAAWPDEKYIDRFRAVGTLVAVAAGGPQLTTLHLARLP